MCNALQPLRCINFIIRTNKCTKERQNKSCFEIKYLFVCKWCGLTTCTSVHCWYGLRYSYVLYVLSDKDLYTLLSYIKSQVTSHSVDISWLILSKHWQASLWVNIYGSLCIAWSLYQRREWYHLVHPVSAAQAAMQHRWTGVKMFLFWSQIWTAQCYTTRGSGGFWESESSAMFRLMLGSPSCREPHQAYSGC